MFGRRGYSRLRKVVGMRALPRVVASAAGCGLAVLCGACGSTKAAARPPAVVVATGTLAGIAGAPCEGALREPPPRVRVSVTLRRGSVAVAQVRVTDVRGAPPSGVGHDQPFAFKEPAGHYTVSTSVGVKRHVVITAGKTTRVELLSSQGCV